VTEKWRAVHELGAYISRAKDWSMNHGDHISPQEWTAVVRGDPELQVVAETGPYIAEDDCPIRKHESATFSAHGHGSASVVCEWQAGDSTELAEISCPT
jgi:hypothetical protein